MNQAIIPFSFENHTIRIIDIEGQPWFNANDVCSVLGLTNPRKAIADHVDAEDVTKRDTLTSGGTQQQNHVNESGLYALILGSVKPEAKRFKRWVTSEVLPSLRKTGRYHDPRQDFQDEAMHIAREAGAMRDENMRLKDELIAAQRQIIQFLNVQQAIKSAPRRQLSEQEKNLIRNLANQGLGPTEIGNRINRSRSAVRIVLRYEGEAA